MRNPLNAIISLTEDAIIQLKEMQGLIEQLKPSGQTQNIKRKLVDNQEKLVRISKIQTSSSKLLLFFVNDILDFSKIKAKKFKKNISTFNLKEAVGEIMGIQQHQADAMETRILTNIENCNETITTDK